MMRSISKILLLALLFIATLVGASLLLFDYDPFREVDQFRPKWSHWQKHKDRYDCIFIGSSRTYHGIIPSLFDRNTAEAGIPTRTFNFGVDGLLSPEDAYWADYILRDPPSGLKWVCVELSIFADDLNKQDPSTARSRHWHDWERSSLAIRSALWPRKKSAKLEKWFESDPGEPWPLATALGHLRLFGMRALNIGRGAAIMQDLLDPAPAGAELGPGNDGYVPYAEKDALKGAAREKYLEQLAHYQANPARITEVRAYHRDSVESVLEAIRKTGATPVFFAAPALGPRRLKMPPSSDAIFLDFSGIADYPDLFEPDVRVDIAHLSPSGATRFTNHFSKGFIEAVGKRDARSGSLR